MNTNKLLTASEIQERLVRFNRTNDWSVFDDVPDSQQSQVLYPEELRFNGKQKFEKKFKLNEEYGRLAKQKSGSFRTSLKRGNYDDC